MLTPLAAALALITTPLALAPTEPAPTDVTLAWTSEAHTEAVITWNETGDVRNRIDIVFADGRTTNIASKFAEAGQPNRVPLSGGLFDQDYRVLVRVVDADGAELSEPASSPEFDTDREPPAVITSVAPQEDGTVVMKWKAGAYTDPNPGDPLDVAPALPYRYVPIASQPFFNEYDQLGPATAETTFVVPARQSPMRVGLRNVPNEWYGYNGISAGVDGAQLTAKIPSTVATGGTLRVTGKAIRTARACDPGPCWSEETPDTGRALLVQSRSSEGTPWRNVATGKAGSDGAFSIPVKFDGAADFRVVATAIPSAGGDARARTFAATDVTHVTAGTGSGNGGEGDGGEGGGLPITGTPVVWIAVAGGLLVVLGALFAVFGRRRRG
ncbi:LPXTG cell wall anchor domain-containing protein [Actinoplanes sp. LDG1-06]|uniref:LPXTG cell wall anchor domain-containing protein n=1 Tax=Paractinoplanes ovalisporus TaxID=2810368 RepID=A0ABS2A662_9ACTN|nr:LPXTG cell wall anchor domain-containing protein [Actinoplanes ovalisporus]MBM2615326.1 LPXTG cell wall anchor domain-containing protein [Actinoplanes ovalisporus]